MLKAEVGMRRVLAARANVEVIVFMVGVGVVKSMDEDATTSLHTRENRESE